MKKTSQISPLQIATVTVPGTSGLIGMTLCPGKIQMNAQSGDWERDLNLDLQAIQDWGANVLITLMEPKELQVFQVSDLPSRAAKSMTHLLLPIVDTRIPDEAWEANWQHVGPQVRMALKRGERVLIHCLGGLGRTGTLAARLLIEFGMEPEEAIREVRKARPGAIENAIQEDYVRRQECIETPVPRPRRIDSVRFERYRGCLIGGAVGDALGAPVEFMDLPAIQATFGTGGIRDYHPAYGRLGTITDDTQMTLFTAEGLLNAHAMSLVEGASDIPQALGRAYQRWLITQDGPYEPNLLKHESWLLGHNELFSSRAPGHTCLFALGSQRGCKEIQPANNDSKGCGGVMRVAPIGLFAASLGHAPELAFQLGIKAAAWTHGHTSGQAPAGVLAMLIQALVQGLGLSEAIAATKLQLHRFKGNNETIAAIESAERLADSSMPPPEAIARLGEGWVAEEALAIALYCALKARNFEEGIVMAVNLTGDSDSTGAITGNLLGVMRGIDEIPERWLQDLELKHLLLEIADDLASVDQWIQVGSRFRKSHFEMPSWFKRYLFSFQDQ